MATTGRGGAGRGQGRKPKAEKAIKEAVALSFFSKFGGESKFWQYVAGEADKKDLRLLFDVGRFLFDHLHGRAVHRTEITGKDEGPVDIRMSIEEARALTRKMLAIDAVARDAADRTPK